MIGHVVMLVGYILQLRFLGLCFRYERDAENEEGARRFRRIRIATTIGIPFPTLLAFVVWCFEYSYEMAVVLVMLEAIPLFLVIGFIVKMMYSVNSSK